MRASARKAISAAKVQIGRSGRFVGQQAIQLHGGIGMTMEYKVGHYFKRVTMIDTLFGDADHHLAELARLGGLVAAITARRLPDAFPYSARGRRSKKRVAAFMEEHVMPAEPVYHEQLEKAADRWDVPPVMDELKKKAKAPGLWNLFAAEARILRMHSPISNTRRSAKSWAARRSAPSRSIARRPTPATWKC